MIAIDNTLLSLLLYPQARPPQDPSTGKPVDRLDDRLQTLVEDWEEDNEKVLIPTPVLSEFLILADRDGPNYLADIDASPYFIVAPFDQKAAIELAVMNLAIMSNTSKRAARRGGAEGTWAKISFDRQIVAIAKANGATALYSDDEGVEKFAKQQSLTVVRTWELPLPSARQIDLPGVENESVSKRKFAEPDEEV